MPLDSFQIDDIFYEVGIPELRPIGELRCVCVRAHVSCGVASLVTMHKVTSTTPYCTAGIICEAQFLRTIKFPI